ncbi:hypothetical protein TRIP_C20458 [Candidatus Zixiibacteriota bacterium]|nr:hypothetical protein TRIP_C20458 [candidate division Zixibacteria bacterium]
MSEAAGADSDAVALIANSPTNDIARMAKIDFFKRFSFRGFFSIAFLRFKLIFPYYS